MVHIKPMLALALMAGLTLPARSNADVEVVTTRGICTEFGFAAKPSQCSRLVSIHTVHSRRTTFTIAGPSLAIGFAGSQDLRLAPDGYLLLIDTLLVGNKSYQASGQCMARLSKAHSRVTAVSCHATFVNGNARAVFKSTGIPIAGQL
jgi:hypothetical protein